ncbi:MAG: patatin-like phospholipase family protein, partial [Methylococcales bacterium]|nr:patatin-like phospholipase family protein [Methylococcales bacterium]
MRKFSHIVLSTGRSRFVCHRGCFVKKPHSTLPVQFRKDVFPSELEQIRKRRKQLGLPDIPPEHIPSTGLGLVGLALSGGGIRSATFSLGVIQALAKHEFLKKVDYLSTVSGGGFTGSCLSSVLNAKDTGSEQDRFPLHYQVGAKEPLGVGHLRNSAHYLAPGGLLDKIRIPALVLRGVLSNLFIFLLIIFMLVLATEVVYEVGQHLQVPLTNLLLGGLTVFIVLAIGFPVIARWLRGGSSWTQRHFWEMMFTVVLLLVLCTVFLIPIFILVDQAIDTSWEEVKESVTANLLRPFEGRDYTQWLVVFGVLVIFMLASRASEQVSQVGGKIILIALGLLGPAVLGMIYLALVVLQIDSPFITPDELFSLDVEYVEDLSDEKITPNLRRQFTENQIRLSKNAEVITLQKDVRWLIRDYERAFSLVREHGDLSVYPDFQDALSRNKIPQGLILSMERKGYTMDPITFSAPELRYNQYEISGSRLYSVDYDHSGDVWSLEQVVAPALLIEVLESTSYDLQISDAPSGTFINEGASLSDDDRELAIRFIEEGNLQDLVVVVDNSTLPFAKPEEFVRIFREALEAALKDIRATVRMAVFWFDGDVHPVVGFTPLTKINKQTLIQTLYRGDDQNVPRLDFKGQLSNTPAALVRAMREITEEGRPRVKKSILLISDGIIDVDGKGHDYELEGWIRGEFAEDAAEAGISIYGIALSKNASFRLFHALARKTKGAFYPVFEAHN